MNSATAYRAVLDQLTSQWQVMRDECARLDRRNILPINREDKDHEQVYQEIKASGKLGWVSAWGPSRDLWFNFPLLLNDTMFPGIEDLCPRTHALLSRLSGVKVAALALFKPHAWLPPHDHPELELERLLTYHLGLEMSDDYCYLWCNGRFLKEQTGKSIVFEGWKDHFAFNYSNRDRLILYMEFSPERLALK